MFLGTFSKRPGERYPITLRYTAADLPADCNLSSGVAVATDLSDDSDVTGTLLDSGTVDINGYDATVTATAGTDGKSYRIVLTLTLDTGSPAYVIEDEVLLRVSSKETVY